MGATPVVTSNSANASRERSFPAKTGLIGGIFRQFLWWVEPIETPGVSYSGTRQARVPAPDRFPKQHHLENEMVITSAHIPAIVALIAGILILIMPRLLNFIVAIYLIVIGLVGLGLLRWLHM
jgi:Protein of unknown function (DUF3096)